MLRSPDSPPHHANVTLPPPLLYAVPLAAGLALHKVRPVRPLPRRLARLLGASLLAAGIGLDLWGIATFRRAGNSLDPRNPVRQLMTSGPFAFSRNPLYVSLTLIYAGIASLINTLWPFVLLPAALHLIRHEVIAREEEYLERTFGAAYQEYTRRVRRWV